MLELIASKFKDSTALVCPERSTAVNGALAALANNENIDAMMDAQGAILAGEDFWNVSEQPWMARYRPYIVRDGMLIIPVKGALLHDFPWQVSNYATGYEYIWQAYKRGMSDPSVKGIALVCNTGGGEVAGCFEAVDRMFEMRGTKPVRGFAHEHAYSAGYALISVCDTITVSKTGGVGSIGVVTSHVNMSKALEDWGLDITFIHFGAHKVDGNPYEALSKDVKDRIQAKINDLGEQFVALVARNRGLDEKAIRDTEALTYTATESVANGLADNIGPLDDALAAFAVDLSTSEGDSEMSDKTATAADNSAVIESARAEGHASGFAAGVAEGSVSAKARISAILGGENAKARPSAALSAAMDTDMTAEQANTFLGKIPAETVEAAAPVVADNKQNFSAAMSEEKNEVGGDDNAKSDGKADADNASSILDLSASFGISGLRKRS